MKIYKTKNLIFIASILAFISCSKSKEQSNAITETIATQTQQKPEVRICASVQSVEDEYIPLFHTNVFIRSDDDELSDKIETKLDYYHKLFDQYHYYYSDNNEGIVKNLKVVNEYISKQQNIQVDSELTALLSESLNLMKLTNGHFNIFLEPVLNLYAGKFSAFPIENTDPDLSDIKKALDSVLTVKDAENCINLTENNFSFLPFKNEYKYSFNLGAIAKGYVAQKIHEQFTDGEYMLSIGSSTIISNGKSYKIGVASTYYKTLALIQIELPSGMALSTSGTGNSYYILADDGKTIRTHILDPKTGLSNDFYWSVIIISDNATVSDALSTALFNVKDESEILKIIENVKNSYNCSIEICLVKDESRTEKTVSLLMTDGFSKYVRKDYDGIGISSSSILGK